MKVLIIEDEETILEFIKEDLDEIGVIVEVAKTGVEAYKILIKNTKTQFHYIILDLSLPDENGVEIARWIKSNFKSKIIIYTSNAYEDYKNKCKYDHFIEKNSKISKVVDIIKNDPNF